MTSCYRFVTCFFNMRWLMLPTVVTLFLSFHLVPSHATLVDDRSMADPTAWVWFNNVSLSTVNNYTSAGYRITALDVRPGGGPAFDVAMVQNTGAYAQNWWWYYGINSVDLATYYSQNNARLIDVRPYAGAGGTTVFAAAMVDNTGVKNTPWWWYYGLDVSTLSAYLSQNNARLIDFHSYDILGITHYSGIMVPNTGSDARNWWFYSSLTPSEVQQYANLHNARLYSLSASAADSARYDVVMVENIEAYKWWWYYNVTGAETDGFLATNNARLIDIDSAAAPGNRLNVIMISNASDQPGTSTVPEPPTSILVGVSLLCLALSKRSRRN